MKKILLTVIIICILIGGGFFGWKQYSKEKQVHTEELFWQGRKALKNNDDVNAFNLLNKAVMQSPENAEFNLWAGLSAQKLGKIEQAHSFFKKSWDIGKKEPIVFMNMIATSSLPKAQKLKTFESMAQEISDEQARLELSALLKYNKGKLNEAAKLLKDLIKKHPEGIYAEFYAQVLIELKEPEAALNMLETVRKSGNMNSSCYIILSKLYFAIDEIQKARELFKEAQNNGLDTNSVIEQYGEALFLYGDNNQSQKILEAIKLNKMFTTADISSVEIFISKLKNNSKISNLLLENIPSEFQQLIDKTNKPLNRFESQRFLEMVCRTLNKLCQQDNWYSSEFISEKSKITSSNNNKKLNAQEKFLRNAKALVSAFPDSLKVPEYNRTTSNARIILMLIESTKNNNDKIESLLSQAEGSRRWLEGERYFGNYLLEKLKEKVNYTAANNSLKIASELLSNNDIVQTTVARNLASQGKLQDALVIFDKLSSSNIIIARSPIVQFMRSQTLLDSGELSVAKNMLLGLLKRGYITESLLTELADVALKLNNSETTDIVLKALDIYAPEHPSLYMLASRIQFQKGNINQAKNELESLLQSDANQQIKDNALTMMSRIYIFNNKNKEALSIINKIATPITDTLILKAEILTNLKRGKEALEILQNIKNLTIPAKKLYAKILAEQGELKKAEKELNDILNVTPNDSEVLTNLALVLSAMGNSSEALKLAQKAIDVNPSDIKANTILAQLLLANGKAKNAANLAIKILSLSPKNEVALILLPSAYNIEEEYIKTIESSDRALKILKNNPFIIMQKAVALVELSKKVDRDIRKSKNNKADSEKTDNTEEELKDEIAALTSDIVFTGAMSEMEHSVSNSENTSLKEFLNNRTSSELREEAIKLLKTIKKQPAAKVLLLKTELLQNNDNLVISDLNNEDLTVNELFSFGVIADSMKKWNISAIAYKKASILQPTNPIILNNYANAVVKGKLKVDNETQKMLIQISKDLPALLNGDNKAINTSASVFNYFKDWNSIINLAKNYSLEFKQDSRLNSILSNAQNNSKKIKANENNNTKKDTARNNQIITNTATK